MKFILFYVIALLVLSINAAAKKRRRTAPRLVQRAAPPGFCDGKTQSDGKQISGGSCSLGIQGDIPSSDHMPSTLIISPDNGAVLESDTQFNVVMAISNIETGHFSDPENDYNIEPQTLNGDGLILGHTHVTIQELDGSKSPPDAKTFAFFKGVEDKADPQGLLTVPVARGDGTPGLAAGNYRICTMAGAFSHQSLVMPVAKRGSQDDCIRISVGGAQTDVKQPEGKQPEGKQPEGKQTEGKQPEGKQTEGKQTEGKQPVGKQPVGKQPVGQKSSS